MVKLDVNSLTLSITEQTVRELIEAIEKAKEEKPFLTSPMPDEPMPFIATMKEERKRGIILVSPSTEPDVKFKIHIETAPNTQKSLGYKLFDLKKELPYY